MAIVLIGTTKCKLCQKVLEASDNIVAFAPLTINEKDPIMMFSDSAFHASCFYKHPLSGKALEREKEFLSHMGPGLRFCVVCEQEIDKPDDYFTLSLLTDDERHPLYEFNFAQMHYGCMPRWAELPRVYKLLQKLQHSGAWKGDALAWILETIKSKAPDLPV